MSPHEHGEVYVLNDGTETDLDLGEHWSRIKTSFLIFMKRTIGNYERFLGVDLTRAHSITTGQIYAEVISREERGHYLGHSITS